MTRLIVMLLLAAVLVGCRVVIAGGSADHTLMYWPHVDGGPVHVEAGEF